MKLDETKTNPIMRRAPPTSGLSSLLRNSNNGGIALPAPPSRKTTSLSDMMRMRSTTGVPTSAFAYSTFFCDDMKNSSFNNSSKNARGSQVPLPGFSLASSARNVPATTSIPTRTAPPIPSPAPPTVAHSTYSAAADSLIRDYDEDTMMCLKDLEYDDEGTKQKLLDIYLKKLRSSDSFLCVEATIHALLGRKQLTSNVTFSNFLPLSCYSTVEEEEEQQETSNDDMTMIKPTPINEETPLTVVPELSVKQLSNSLLSEERRDLRSMLRSLQDYDIPMMSQLSTPAPSSKKTSGSGRNSPEEVVALQSRSHDTVAPHEHFLQPGSTVFASPIAARSQGTSSTIPHDAHSSIVDGNSSSNSCVYSSEDDEEGGASSSGSGVLSVRGHLRADQFDQWNDRFSELLAYKDQHGDCNVPYVYPENTRLCQWVKRQRHQYKLKYSHKHSNMTDERETLLKQAGFCWDSRASNWESRLDELKRFKELHGHFAVGMKDRKYRPLAVWLKRQRHHARQLLLKQREEGGQDNSNSGGGTGITQDQLNQLIELGVSLNVHRASKSKKAATTKKQRTTRNTTCS